MSADDTILIIPVLMVGGMRYFVVRMQAAENADNPEWLTNYIQCCPGVENATKSLRKAKRVAERMHGESPAEYGVRHLIYAVYA